MKVKVDWKFLYHYWAYLLTHKWRKEFVAQFVKPGSDKMRGYWPFNEFDLMESKHNRIVFYCGTGDPKYRRLFIFNGTSFNKPVADIIGLNSHYEPILKAYKCAEVDRCVAARRHKRIKYFPVNMISSIRWKLYVAKQRRINKMLDKIIDKYHARLEIFMLEYKKQGTRKDCR